MALTEKTTIVAEGIANLIEQFRDAPNIIALLTPFLTQEQELEASAFEILIDTALPNAIGEQLDGIGRIVGEPRFGRTDADYRIAINARILVNQSEGTPEELIAIVNALISASTSITFTESFPAEFEIETTDAITVSGTQVGKFVIQAKPAGVHGIFRWHETATPFAFDTTSQGFDTGEFAGARDLP